MSLVKVIVAASAGVAAGIVIGLLAAPASGTDTRQKLTDGVDELRKKILKLKDDAQDRFNDLKDDLEESKVDVKKISQPT